MRGDLILRHILSQPVAIDPDWLDKIIGIVQRDKDISALAAKELKPYKFNTFKRGRTAVIPIDGPIFAKADMFTDISGAVSTDQLARAVQEAIDDRGIDNIVMKFDRAPGGELSGGDEFAQLIRTSPKPVYAHVTGQCCSLAYWYASQAKEISISPTSMLGSIGVVQAVKTGKDNDKIEIVNTDSPLKREDIDSPGARERIQANLDKMAQPFFEDVAAGRNVPVSTVKYEFGRGGVLIGQECVDIGMADRVCSFEDLMTRLEASSDNNPEGAFAMEKDDKIKALESELATTKVLNDELTAKVSNLEASLTEANEKISAMESDHAKTLAEYEKKVAGYEAEAKAAKVEASRAQAKELFSSKFEASGLDEKYAKKVAACVGSVDGFIKDGQLDAEAYGQAVDVELEDWKKTVGAATKDPSVKGFGTAPVQEDVEAAAEAAADRIFDAYLK